MNKQEAYNIFNKIRDDYKKIPYPKYQHADLKDLKSDYKCLMDLKGYLEENRLFTRLINSISQIINRLDTKSTINTTSERGINKAILPVVKKPGNEAIFPFEWISEKTGQTCFINRGYWGANNLMLMDMLGYHFLLKEGKNHLPDKPNPIFDNFESIKTREEELNRANRKKIYDEMRICEKDLSDIMNKKYWINFNDRDFRKFTGKRKKKSSDILKLILATSRVEFKISFPVRLKEEEQLKEKWYPMNMFSRFFEFGYVDKKIRKDGIIQEREYYVIFDTILGELFVHNLLTKNYDWFDNSFYSLPESAQLFYRQFLSHHDFIHNQLNLDTIVQRMGFHDKNITNLINGFEKNTLGPLQNAGFIISYEREDGLFGKKYIIHKPPKKRRKKT